VPEGGHVASVEELPGANTHSSTLGGARKNLREAVALVIEANREDFEQSPRGQAMTR
jgi:predicted RNase H-like HicB family nuclease